MTDTLTSFNDRELMALDGYEDDEYAAQLTVRNNTPERLKSVALTVEGLDPDIEAVATVLLDRTRAQQLVEALVRHFGLEVATAERLRADDARDEALAEKTDTALLGPKATTADA